MTSAMDGFTKEELDEVVTTLKVALADESLRKLSQRAVQAKIWHLHPEVAAILSKLRRQEEEKRREVMAAVSQLVYQFHEHTLDTTLARAGVVADDRVHPGSFLDQKPSFDLLCLDAKERLYQLMNEYGWLEDFFRQYPLHFYENSFQFVSRIPKKKLKAKVNVIGLGIGGSMAVSGLAKAGIEHVCGYEKRQESGRGNVSSRYQNASWRAYDIAERLLDADAYNALIEYRQSFNVQYDDGTSGVITSDRVQIILGSAIQNCLASAKRYGATLKFGVADAATEVDESDLVGLFSGAHTSEIFPNLKEEMGIHSWPDLTSDCKMWLKIKPSTKKEFYCTRSGEVGAGKWHYTIESARNTPEDITRVKDCLLSQRRRYTQRSEAEAVPEEDKAKAMEKFESQLKQLEDVQNIVENGQAAGGEQRFDYIFTNAPINEHNLAKYENACKEGSVVLDGGYSVDVGIASNAKFSNQKLLDGLKTTLVACGGDACVNPNPQAAYGATLACESANMFVQLAVGFGHLNSIVDDLEHVEGHDTEKLKREARLLKSLLADHYNARSRCENYFQFVQTLICNLYSLPPFEV